MWNEVGGEVTTKLLVQFYFHHLFLTIIDNMVTKSVIYA